MAVRRWCDPEQLIQLLCEKDVDVVRAGVYAQKSTIGLTGTDRKGKLIDPYMRESATHNRKEHLTWMAQVGSTGRRSASVTARSSNSMRVVSEEAFSNCPSCQLLLVYTGYNETIPLQ